MKCYHGEAEPCEMAANTITRRGLQNRIPLLTNRGKLIATDVPAGREICFLGRISLRTKRKRLTFQQQLALICECFSIALTLRTVRTNFHRDMVRPLLAQ